MKYFKKLYKIINIYLTYIHNPFFDFLTYQESVMNMTVVSYSQLHLENHRRGRHVYLFMYTCMRAQMFKKGDIDNI